MSNFLRNPFRRRGAGAGTQADASTLNNNNNNNTTNTDTDTDNNDPLERFLGDLGERAQGLGESAVRAASAAASSAGFDPEAIRRATEASLGPGIRATFIPARNASTTTTTTTTTNNNTNAGGAAAPTGPTTGAPPASARALADLPVVTVSPEDLVDPVNRECCVCLDNLLPGSRVLRLPCAHIFHPACVTDWLLQHCT
jgi:hypothetical protein